MKQFIRTKKRKDWLQQGINMKIIAHRGLSAHYHENTLEAFERALVEGVDGIEFDLHQVENKFVIFHDFSLERLNGDATLVNQLSLEQVQNIVLNDNHRIPLLEDIFTLVKGKVPLNLELKAIDDIDALLSLVVEYIYMHDGDVIFSSFNHPLLQTLSKKLRDTRIQNKIKIGALVGHTPLDHAAYALHLGADIAAIDAHLVTPEFVQNAHQFNLEVWCYTVNSKHMLSHLQDMGVDAVFSNDPALMKAGLAEK